MKNGEERRASKTQALDEQLPHERYCFRHPDVLPEAQQYGITSCSCGEFRRSIIRFLIENPIGVVQVPRQSAVDIMRRLVEDSEESEVDAASPVHLPDAMLPDETPAGVTAKTLTPAGEVDP